MWCVVISSNSKNGIWKSRVITRHVLLLTHLADVILNNNFTMSKTILLLASYFEHNKRTRAVLTFN